MNLYQILDQIVDEMIAEHAKGASFKLTYPALAARAGVSLSTVNQQIYRDIRHKLKAAKPARPGTSTNEDAAKWKQKYYQLQKEKAQGESSLKEQLIEAQETIDRLLQKLQSAALKKAGTR